MVNMTMLQKDLDTEMTVVRNEMENGENSPLNVLHQRVLAAAYNFHNYGKTVIGNRTDVERVPIANLAVFYQKYYQPDNADADRRGTIRRIEGAGDGGGNPRRHPQAAARADATVHGRSPRRKASAP